MTNANDMAFSPTPYKEDYTIKDFPNSGLTKLEYFAGVVMQGLLANSFYAQHVISNVDKTVSERSVQIAKALIEELNKK